MKRREMIQKSAAFGFLAAIPISIPGRAFGAKPASESAFLVKPGPATEQAHPLKPPASGSIPVAFLISQGAAVIDFCGPWEVFQDVKLPAQANQGFQLYTVAESASPIRVSGGMKITPDYTLRSAPKPKVVVIPAQSGESDAMLEWIRKSAETADVVMSVCTGAFLLAGSGLLAGKSATTHHDSYRGFERRFRNVKLKRGVRFVEEGQLASAGGLTSGIDLALRVVERYYGREAAQQTAYYMEYQGQGWMNENSNSLYANVGTEADSGPYCLVCGMDIDPKTADKTVYQGQTYYFCMPEHKKQFEASPEKYLEGK
jgi:YHS domain-containing protein/putative intracellular protease/amidase